jgi:hypothetical protein
MLVFISWIVMAANDFIVVNEGVGAGGHSSHAILQYAVHSPGHESQ